jgi:hypothetical protein
MKTLATLLIILAATTFSFAQGTVHFANGSTSLISADGVPMPVSGTQPFIFAIFLAPSTTVDGDGHITSINGPLFQLAGAYTQNSPIAAGRVVLQSGVDVTSAGGNPNSFGPGSTVDYLVRGWSANAGSTWAEALAFWNLGNPPQSMWFGQSTIGNDLVLGGGAIPNTIIFGPNGGPQIPGFNLYNPIPEPSTLAMAGLGAVALWRFRRR